MMSTRLRLFQLRYFDMDVKIAGGMSPARSTEAMKEKKDLDLQSYIEAF
jgi:hypothetical protein